MVKVSQKGTVMSGSARFNGREGEGGGPVGVIPGPQATPGAHPTKSINSIVKASLAKWDVLAGLSERHKESVLELSSIAEERSFPGELATVRRDPSAGVISESENSNRSEPLERKVSLHPDLSVSENTFAAIDEVGKEVVIENAQQFFVWYAKVEDEMENEQEKNFRDNLILFQGYRKQCDDLLAYVDDSISVLTKMEEDYEFVSTKTGALHEACEQLQEEQTRLVTFAESINNKLSYFTELDRISAKLNSSTMSVASDSFPSLLSKIDESLIYINNHQQYQGSSVYGMRFRHCLSRALMLVKVHVTNTLKNTTNEVFAQAYGPKSETSELTVFYGKFRACAPKIKPLMHELEARSSKGEEYGSVLEDCRDTYFQQRMLLLSPSLTKQVEEMQNSSGGSVGRFTKSGSEYMCRVLQQEHDLFFFFFSQDCQRLLSHLEEISSILYEVLRPRIIKLSSFKELVEICEMLKSDLAEHKSRGASNRVGIFEIVGEQILADVQERLVYRTGSYIQAEIERFSPSENDLKYPEKLSENVHQDLKKEGDSFASDTVEDISAALYRKWFPVLTKTIMMLSSLHRCLPKATFDSIAVEALSLCCAKLLEASQSITSNVDETNGCLFLIQHLLILREQISPFSIDLSIAEKDFDMGKVKEAAFEFYERKRNFFEADGLLGFLGSSTVVSHSVDIKKDIDMNLKKSCENFISHVTKEATGPMESFLAKCLAYSTANPGKSLAEEEFANPNSIKEVVSATYRLLTTDLKEMMSLMSLYLSNKDTEYILFKPIKNNILGMYNKLWVILNKPEFTDEDRQIIGCQTVEQISFLMSK
eukprot:Nk52_evm32s1992 gene=Nk52_evmTU32s1992